MLRNLLILALDAALIVLTFLVATSLQKSHSITKQLDAMPKQPELEEPYKTEDGKLHWKARRMDRE